MPKGVEEIMGSQEVQHPLSVDLFEISKRIQGEYEEMPGMCLTLSQARRLLGLDQNICTAILDSLVDRGFLTRTRDGRYIRFRA